MLVGKGARGQVELELGLDRGPALLQLLQEASSRFSEKGLDMMVAAITSHKALTMLKRYTHLKAKNLYAKLE